VPKIGIMSAMQEEISSLLTAMDVTSKVVCGQRTYHVGTLWGTSVVIVFSRWGKVAAASTATELVARFDVEEIIFTGVAGGVRTGINIGDIVVGSSLVQHDMDARPLFDRHVIPLLDVEHIKTDLTLSQRLYAAAGDFVQQLANEVPEHEINRFGIKTPQVHRSEIASGDKFFASKDEISELGKRFPAVACVEMEGAAVAQVCHEHQIPFAVVRTISDSADASAALDFPAFVQMVATKYAEGILRRFMSHMR
jgi:adenosylhomocysteine nucleosidase